VEDVLAKAVALFSGGLDSQLAVKLVLNQDIEVLALHFTSVFNSEKTDDSPPAAERAAADLGMKIETIDITAEQIALIHDPPHGFGAAANPCIDCHALMLRIAGKRMEETGADFIVTGEVLGQRPMSQRRHSLDLIDRETGLGGKILRPLSARALPLTDAETNGIVKRNELEGIVGRTRTRQMQLAREFGLTRYPSPAGGCLLTDHGFGARVEDLLRHGELSTENARLLKLGRHYRLPSGTKVVVGRNEAENSQLEELADASDVLLALADIPGPSCVIRGASGEEELLTAAALTARCSKAKASPSARLIVRRPGGETVEKTVEVAPATDAAAEALSVNKRATRK
jgi:tRNA U34 2-thiouridine synthase MnmA/TrmU